MWWNLPCFKLNLIDNDMISILRSVIDKCNFGTFRWWPPTLLPTPSFSVQKCHSHYFSMNEKHNNQASIIIQDMWLKMLYLGRYWPQNLICKTSFERFMFTACLSIDICLQPVCPLTYVYSLSAHWHMFTACLPIDICLQPVCPLTYVYSLSAHWHMFTACLPIACDLSCELKKDINGCEICECIDPCEMIDCEDGYQCVVLPIRCITTPCPVGIAQCIGEILIFS